MLTRLFHYLINSFLVSTRSNYKKALVLGTDHEAKLLANQTDPVVAGMVASFTPVIQAYKFTDLNVRTVTGEYKGETQTVEQLFETLSKEHLPDWEAAIYVLFRKGTPPATALLPQGRQPFQKGTYESRIQEIDVLGQKCALIAALQPLSVGILAFHVQIESARQVQQSTGEGQLKSLRTLREQARVTMCNAMFGNLGLLMNLYQSDPRQVANYFDFTLLRQKSKDDPQDAVVTLYIKNTGGLAVANATAQMLLPDGVVLTQQSDAAGKVMFTLEALEEIITVTVTVTAAGYITLTETGPIEPGEDITTDMELSPMPPMPPTP